MVEILMQQLGGDTARQLGQKVGLDESAASKAIAGALPMVLGGLARNAQQKGGAEALLGALDRDHDGSILDDLGGFLKGGGGSQGEAILGHVFGGKRPAVESALGQASGIDKGQAGQLMAMLAPLVMAALAKQKKSAGLDASGLARMLGQERQAAPAGAGAAMGMVGKLLDRDGDGDIKDDIASMGAGLLGNLLGGGRS
jgi:hypothetical protein